MRYLILLLAFATTFAAPAWSQFSGRGAIQGAAEGLRDLGEILQQQAIQNEIDRHRHENEMRILERKHQLRMEAIQQEENNRERRRKVEAEQRGQELLQEYRRNQQAAIAKQEKLKEEEAQREREIEKIENKHPGWRNLVKSKGFNDWYLKQPESLRRLSSSEKADDAITVLDLYKRDRGARR